MKPPALVHHGDSWAVWSTTTDRPGEIRVALAERGIGEVYKGDQNQAWDAILANHCLLRAVGDAADLCFFVQDEKLGTPDNLLARRWRALAQEAAAGEPSGAYRLTEDYYRGRKGAVWEHQDVSYGLFYTEAVSPEQFGAAAVHLLRTAALWREYVAGAGPDRDLLAVMERLGCPLDPRRSDASTRLGPPVNGEDLAAVFAEHPEAAVVYALTRTTGLYGIVPAQNDGVTLSSIPAGSPELRQLAAFLLVRVAARGAMRCAGSARERRAVKERARRLAEWGARYLGGHPEASLADFQAELGRHLTEETFPEDRITLTRTSQFMRLGPRQLEELARPEETLFSLLDVALRHPAEFSDAYNQALNRMGFGLQRVKFDPRRELYEPPFFVQFSPGGPGSPGYRFSMRLQGPGFRQVTLTNETAGTRAFTAAADLNSAARLCEAVWSELRGTGEVTVVGKAAPFAAELRRWPRALGLPRQGSKYVPMVDILMADLRERGLLPEREGLVLRVGLNALDRLDGAAGHSLRLPRFLEPVLGREVAAPEFARRWREVAEDARAALAVLAGAEFGQHVHLVRLLSRCAHGESLEQAGKDDRRLAALLEQLRARHGSLAALEQFGREFPPEAAHFVDQRLERREALLAERRALRAATPPELEDRRRRLETELLLVYAACVRRLWQRAESLAYLNDRPYSLALYLRFGADFFRHLCRNVEFDLEFADTPQSAPCA